MITQEKMNSIQKTARIAGLLTLMIVVFAPFSVLYVPSILIVPGDAATTANNIMASEGLFRLSIVSDSIVFLIEIVLTVLLYVLLKPVSKTLSLVAAFSRLAMTIVQGINLLNHCKRITTRSFHHFINEFKNMIVNLVFIHYFSN